MVIAATTIVVMLKMIEMVMAVVTVSEMVTDILMSTMFFEL